MKYTINSESVTGINHKLEMKNNQDAVCSRVENDCFAIAVADGAGSHEYSEIGAGAVVMAVNTFLISNIKRILGEKNEIIKHEIMSEIHEILREQAEKMNCRSTREFGSTLIFAASDGKKYITGHLGDGVAAGIYHNKLSVISFPENSDDGIGTFLTTSVQAEKKLRITRGNLDYYDELVLMTDGMASGIFDNGYIIQNPENEKIDSALKKAVCCGNRDDASFVHIKWGI